MMAKKKSIQQIISLGQGLFMAVLVSSLFVSCTTTGSVTPETRYIVLDKPAPIPPGAVRYCWEEPMVQIEPNGAGLDGDGVWYHASYMAVREVRQGRWRPCRAVPSEVKGETRNER